MSDPATILPVPAAAAISVPATALPEGVRAGNENLVRLTESAGVKTRALIAREQQGDYLRVARRWRKL